jgi:hypothetical protein
VLSAKSYVLRAKVRVRVRGRVGVRIRVSIRVRVRFSPLIRSHLQNAEGNG